MPTSNREPAPKAILDPSFGHGGKLTLPDAPGGDEAHGAITGSNGMLLSEGRELRLLSNSGRIVTSFGRAAKLVPRSAADREFSLSGFTLDNHGRLLVVGTSRSDEYEVGPSGGPAPLTPSAVRILRFLPDGHLDRSFGRNGVVETTFGLPLALDEAGLPLQPAPSVRATGVAVDRHGRILVTGGAGIGLAPSCVHDVFSPQALSAAFIARLRPNGELDPGFGENGIIGGRELDETPLRAEEVGDPVIGPGGTITYRSTSISGCRSYHGHLGVGQLTADGKIRKAFGRQGAVRGRFTAFVAERDGSVVAVERLPWSEGEAFRARLIRIGAEGKIDRSFGHGGRTVVRLGWECCNEPDSLGVDREGRILLGGSLVTPERSSIFLVRLGADGRQEMNFGPNGRVATPFPKPDSFGPSDLFLDSRGRVITVHQLETREKPSALVVTRYLLGN